MSDDDWLSEYRSELLSGDEVSHSTIAVILQRIERVDYRDIELASELTTENVNYLYSWQIDRLIEAAIDSSDVTRICTENREFFRKFGSIISPILLMLRRKDNFSLRYAIQVIHDRARDFSNRDTPYRKDRAINDQIRLIQRVSKSVSKARDHLRELIPELGLQEEYENNLNAFLVIKKDIDTDALRQVSTHPLTFEHLVDSLNVLLASAEITSLDISSDHPRSIWPNGQTKADIVECVYDLSRVCLGPPLVTTPGSDFSLICSLIFELATGSVGESLAGAINRFVHSREKKEQDEYEAELREDNEAFESNDNFYFQRQRINRSIDNSEWYRELSLRVGINPFTKLISLMRALSSAQDVEMLQNEHGPFILWASQMPSINTVISQAEVGEAWERVREARILLGEKRRALKVDTK